MERPNITFASNHNAEFYKTLQQRVREYFKENNISRFGNAGMVFKTIFMISLYVVPFILLNTVFNESVGLTILMWVLMGFGMAGVGLSIMHDANHGAYSKNDTVNKLLGLVINGVGGSDVNWRIQHNVLHHTYTNVSGYDEDIDPGKIMRFTPRAERLGIHKYQHIYAWFFYGMMTLMWCTAKDFVQAARFKRQNLLKTQNITYGKLIRAIIITKILYFTIILFIPLYFQTTILSIPATIGCFLLMHFIAGVSLAAIFQPAHVVPTSTYEIPNESGVVEADWAVNQLYNTANFAPKAKFFSWFVGGLNFQVEHHLFPTISHVHYKKLSEIVKKTASEYNLPYYSYKTFFDAVKEHTKMLHDLGTKDYAPAMHH
ncbi:MAG: acyl-CoA desaturase [Crocinitomicaceae bacterium]|nr:acyl-CoA desaturase [Crocinitomicaceae bacterium]